MNNDNNLPKPPGVTTRSKAKARARDTGADEPSGTEPSENPKKRRKIVGSTDDMTAPSAAGNASSSKTRSGKRYQDVTLSEELDSDTPQPAIKREPGDFILLNDDAKGIFATKPIIGAFNDSDVFTAWQSERIGAEDYEILIDVVEACKELAKQEDENGNSLNIEQLDDVWNIRCFKTELAGRPITVFIALDPSNIHVLDVRLLHDEAEENALLYDMQMSLSDSKAVREIHLKEDAWVAHVARPLIEVDGEGLMVAINPEEHVEKKKRIEFDPKDNDRPPLMCRNDAQHVDEAIARLDDPAHADDYTVVNIRILDKTQTYRYYAEAKGKGQDESKVSTKQKKNCLDGVMASMREHLEAPKDGEPSPSSSTTEVIPRLKRKHLPNKNYWSLEDQRGTVLVEDLAQIPHIGNLQVLGYIRGVNYVGKSTAESWEEVYVDMNEYSVEAEDTIPPRTVYVMNSGPAPNNMTFINVPIKKDASTGSFVHDQAKANCFLIRCIVTFENSRGQRHDRMIPFVVGRRNLSAGLLLLDCGKKFLEHVIEQIEEHAREQSKNPPPPAVYRTWDEMKVRLHRVLDYDEAFEQPINDFITWAKTNNRKFEQFKPLDDAKGFARVMYAYAHSSKTQEDTSIFDDIGEVAFPGYWFDVSKERKNGLALKELTADQRQQMERIRDEIRINSHIRGIDVSFLRNEYDSVFRTFMNEMPPSPDLWLESKKRQLFPHHDIHDRQAHRQLFVELYECVKTAHFEGEEYQKSTAVEQQRQSLILSYVSDVYLHGKVSDATIEETRVAIRLDDDPKEEIRFIPLDEATRRPLKTVDAHQSSVVDAMSLKRQFVLPINPRADEHNLADRLRKLAIPTIDLDRNHESLLFLIRHPASGVVFFAAKDQYSNYRLVYLTKEYGDKLGSLGLSMGDTWSYKNNCFTNESKNVSQPIDPEQTSLRLESWDRNSNNQVELSAIVRNLKTGAFQLVEAALEKTYKKLLYLKKDERCYYFAQYVEAGKPPQIILMAKDQPVTMPPKLKRPTQLSASNVRPGAEYTIRTHKPLNRDEAKEHKGKGGGIK